MSDMRAGPELDYAIAENVMGWKWRSNKWNCPGWWADDLESGFGGLTTFRPSFDVAHAWLAVEKLCNGDSRWRFDLSKIGADDYFARFSDPRCEAWGETAPLAICRVALKAAEQPKPGGAT